LDVKRGRTHEAQHTPAPSAKRMSAGVFAFNDDSFYSLSHNVEKVNWFVSHGTPLI
jgi:hypothetical protein